MATEYTGYGKKLGFTPLRGKEAEFERISAELHEANFNLKWAVFAESDDTVSAIREQRDTVLKKLAAVSRPKAA